MNHEKKIHRGAISKIEVLEKRVDFYEAHERELKGRHVESEARLAKEIEELKMEVEKREAEMRVREREFRERFAEVEALQKEKAG